MCSNSYTMCLITRMEEKPKRNNVIQYLYLEIVYVDISIKTMQQLQFYQSYYFILFSLEFIFIAMCCSKC